MEKKTSDKLDNYKLQSALLILYSSFILAFQKQNKTILDSYSYLVQMYKRTHAANLKLL